MRIVGGLYEQVEPTLRMQLVGNVSEELSVRSCLPLDQFALEVHCEREIRVSALGLEGTHVDGGYFLQLLKCLGEQKIIPIL